MRRRFLSFERIAAVAASALALGTLGVGAAWAMAQGSTAGTTTTTKTTTTPMQTTITSKVTKVSASAHYFVESDKTIYVTQKTSYHHVKGLGGVKTNRRYKVVVTDVNGKYTAVSVTRV